MSMVARRASYVCPISLAKVAQQPDPGLTSAGNPANAREKSARNGLAFVAA